MENHILYNLYIMYSCFIRRGHQGLEFQPRFLFSRNQNFHLINCLIIQSQSLNLKVNTNMMKILYQSRNSGIRKQGKKYIKFFVCVLSIIIHELPCFNGVSIYMIIDHIICPMQWTSYSIEKAEKDSKILLHSIYFKN